MFVSLLAAAVAATSPPTLSRGDVAACLVTSKFAANLETLAAARAEAGPGGWSDACRAAREADARRRAALRVLFETGQAPFAGFTSATKYIRLSREAPDPLHRDLYRHVAHDQAARESLQKTEKAGYAPGANPLTLRLVDALTSADALQADAASRTWLLATVSARGWFTVSGDGETADNAASLIVRHADADPAAQRRLIAIMEPLAAAGETNVRAFSIIYDRWARGAGAPQRYGWMGDCVQPGVWQVRPVEDEAGLDARRKAAGLPPMAEYVATQAKACR